MDKVIIRQVQAEDMDAVARLWLALVEYHRQLDSDLPPAAPQGAKRYARRLIERLDDPMSRVLVAETEGKVVGYVLGVVVDLAPEMFAQEASGFLADIFVDEAYRREGVGKALVDGLADWFRSKGLHYFEWHVAARNDAGIAFWQTMGGREVMLRMRAELDSKPSNP
ncbi:MAG TPA: GNAT family N-acetyltransferase [Phototrophicaceae bacterium]|nr:GNAT family N-acetyltransferase [Phototrophicaceae bacterium]